MTMNGRQAVALDRWLTDEPEEAPSWARRRNGWTNTPTWYVYLWLTSEEGSYFEALDTVAHADDPRIALKEMVEDRAPTGHGLYTDMLLWALDLVNWDEIAAAFAEDAA